MRTSDIHWLAGLVEGEGSIKHFGTPNIALHMTDQDTIERAASVLGVSAKGPYTAGAKAHYKPRWVAEVFGARAVAWIMTLYPLLQSRRKGQCRDVLEKWKAAPGGRWVGHVKKARVSKRRERLPPSVCVREACQKPFYYSWGKKQKYCSHSCYVATLREGPA